MVTKLSKVAAIMLGLFFPMFMHAQEYRMTDVSINGIKMTNALLDYNTFFNCKMVNKHSDIIEETETTVYKITYDCDSLLMIYYKIGEGNKYPFTYYIEILSDQYIVQLKDMKFLVGMSVNDIAQKLPSIKQDYDEYIGRNNSNIYQPAYFGISLLIETNIPEEPLYPCQGLSFKIKEGIVIAILVDFRTDGDFD